MSTGITGTDVLDLEISLAYVVLGGARGMWQRCPSADNARRVEEAEVELDHLLDRRLTEAA